MVIHYVSRFHEVHDDPQLQGIRLGSFLAAEFYPEEDMEPSRQVAYLRAGHILSRDFLAGQ